MFKSAMLMLALVLSSGVSLMATSTVARADLQLPSYAAGADVKTTIESKGKKVTDVALLVVAVLGILGLIYGAGLCAMGQADRGKPVLGWALAGLAIAGCVYGIAALVV